MFWTHDLSSIIFTLGPLAFRWYGLMYALGFLAGYFFLTRAVARGRLALHANQVETLVLALFLGVIVGGRVGEFLLYRFDALFADPLEILRVWHGGMSFHGGLVGVILALIYFARRHKISLLVLADAILIPVTFGLVLGRLGNFINGELWGRVTSGEWGIIFPRAGDLLPRHPSQLYEAFYSLGIFGVLLFFWHAKARPGTISFSFLLLYGVCRTFVEFFFREPIDGFLGSLPLGAAYSVPLILAGIIGLIWIYRKKE